MPSKRAANEWRVAIKRREPVFRIIFTTAAGELRGDIGNGFKKMLANYFEVMRVTYNETGINDAHR